MYALDLPPHLRDVLLVLADHAHPDGGEARPGLARIAWKLGKTERTIRRALSDLRDMKLIVPTRHHAPGRPTVYTLVLSNGPCKVPIQEGLFAPTADTQRTSTSSEQRTPVSETEDAGVPLTPLNPPSTQKPSASVRRDESFEALADATGLDIEELTDDARGWLNRALKKIRKAAPDLNGELSAEIRLRAARYAAAHPTWELTPSALAKWWPKLGKDRAPPVRGFESASTRNLRNIGRMRREGGSDGGRSEIHVGVGAGEPSRGLLSGPVD